MTSAAEDTIARLKEKAEMELTEDEVIQDEIEESLETEVAPKKHGDSMREYVILQAWTEVGRVTAQSSEAAVKQLPDASLKNGQKYVVVPVRNWNEHEVAIETKTTISIK